jgi:hypothetical protein
MPSPIKSLYSVLREYVFMENIEHDWTVIHVESVKSCIIQNFSQKQFLTCYWEVNILLLVFKGCYE